MSSEEIYVHPARALSLPSRLSSRLLHFVAEDRSDGKRTAHADYSTHDGTEDGRQFMIYIGGILVLALLAYLVFVVLRPEKF
jgi:K+-transporting ATPase KdpF subunit